MDWRDFRRNGQTTKRSRTAGSSANKSPKHVSIKLLRSLPRAGQKMFVEAAVQWWVWPTIVYLMPMAWVRVVDSSLPCPQKCDCWLETLQVNCSERLLVTVPEGFPSNTRLLDLSRNQLKTLSYRQFSSLVHLRELNLSDNLLSMIEGEAFQGLQSLHTLRIRNNQLKILPAGIFSGLQNLRMLDISRNEIVILLDYTFRELGSLQHLEAGENDLVFISPQAFVGLHNLQEFNLDRSNLSHIPMEAFFQLQALTRLRLQRLNLSVLPNNSFRRLSHLRTLMISHCPSLDTVASNSLLGLNLISLTISHSNLTAIPYTSLNHLVYLRYLDLSYNPITIVNANMLGDLLRLQEFHLVGCNLFRIEPGAFRGLAHFRVLNVSSNHLPTLEEAVFRSVGNLETLRLDSNPLACDCRLLWLVRRRLRLNFDGHQPSCASPYPVQGLGFSEVLLPGIFTCRRARILNRRPQAVKVEEGHTVLLFCSGDGDPMPIIIWLTPQRRVVSTNGRIRVLNNGTLEVRYAQLQDDGTYVCVASNAAGNDTVPVRLHVRGSSSSFFLNSNSSFRNLNPYPFDAKTLIIAITTGFFCFLGSMSICFVFMLVWSHNMGKVTHTAIEFVPPRINWNSSSGGGSGGADAAKFSMKLM
nr:leucine-rich repeat and immunoglobulin-like domain-containing nogo receptor-interacting protein 1 isoform X2 [Paramormyrops kingsleyae]